MISTHINEINLNENNENINIMKRMKIRNIIISKNESCAIT